MNRIIILLLLLGFIAPAFAAKTESIEVKPVKQDKAEKLEKTEGDTAFFEFLRSDPEAYSIISVGSGLTAHKANFLLPVTYNSRTEDDRWEFEFQISAKQKLFDRNLYFAYTQRSFWEFYNQAGSAPFRETVYNPELFYRWTPDPVRWHHWGADVGVEHESNGQSLPNSRSWNRIYVAPFQARGKQLLYFKLWYRVPEDGKKAPDDARGDDNPDIEDYYGIGEFRIQRQFGDKGRMAAMMVRGNPATGKGAVEVNLSQPNSGHSLFYSLYFWHGYGESLIDYNHSITRVGIGIMLSR